MLLTKSNTSVHRAPAQPFFHPELNALRFLAFLLVFYSHMQPVHGLSRFSAAGAFGVPVFFLLSSYLIFTLLMRECETTGTVQVRLFFLRRLLRIWPLYLAALLAGFLIGRVRHDLLMPKGMLASFLLFTGNLYVARHGWTDSPASVLWSIPVEEQFYLLVPLIAKITGRRGVRVVCVLALVCAYTRLVLFGSHPLSDPDTVWVNSLVCFQFFAVGGLLATRQRPYLQGRRLPERGLLLLAGFTCFAAAAKAPLLLPPALASLQFVIRYALGALGAVALFLGFLGFPARQRSWLGYLGIISFGLYVFHAWTLEFATELLENRISVAMHRNALIDLFSLASTITLAALSYRYFERPILKQKARLEIVRSQPI